MLGPDGTETTPAASVTPGVATGVASAPAETAAPVRVTDVWSWAGDKYRVRAYLSLLITFLLFCGLCIFTHWLHAGMPFDFALSSYHEPLRFWGPQTQNLYNFVLFPISVDQTPVHGVVIGLLLASIVAVPICVSILYRFRHALLFIAAVWVFAHLPWMAITLVSSCVLASVRPFRMSFRFGAALAGMLPVLLYLFLATRGPAEPLAASISPERKLLLAGPWLLALLAACMMLAVIIFIARAVNYRPGAVAPVMAVMFATPVLLFRTYVGADELGYRVLEARFGPRSEEFEPVRDASETILKIVHEWTTPGLEREPRRSALVAIWNANPDEQAALKHRVVCRLLLELMDKRREAYEACKDFIADHPTSRYVPNALFIQARVLDTRLDERRLVGGTAERELYADFPHVESEPVWTNLLSAYANSPLATAARRRLAQLRLRKGDADGALAALTPGALAATPPSSAGTQPVMRPLLQTRPPESSLEYEPDQDLFEADALRELIAGNKDDARFGGAPLAALAALDPHRPGYRDQLAELAAEYRDSLLFDNLVVRWASAAPTRDARAATLRACIERFPDGDALPQAVFELGELESQPLAGGDEAQRAAGIARLREVAARYAQSCWGRRAAERLRMLVPQLPPATLPTELP